MKTVKWGIIGCGNVCEIKSGPAFYKCDNSILHAVMRRDAIKAADFAQRHNVKHWYTNATDIINNPEIDAIYVATPPSSHLQYAIEALKAGKSVYVEKPMAMDYAECLTMVEAAKHNRQKLWVAHYRRALPYFSKIKSLLNSGIIGKVQTVLVQYFRPPASCDLRPDTQTWRVDKSIAGGGYFYDLAPHTIDILHFLFGKFTDVNAYTANTAGLYDVEDAICASFRFVSGIIGSGIWSYANNPLKKEDSIGVIGEKGNIRFSTFLFTPIELQTATGIKLFNLPPPQHIQQPLIQSIVDEMLGKGKCLSTGETAVHTAWVIDKIFEKL